MVFMFCVFSVGILVVSGFFVYYVYDGKLQSSVNNTIVPTFQPNVTSVTNNQYSNSFNPQTNNGYNVSIIINRIEVVCREDGCTQNNTA